LYFCQEQKQNRNMPFEKGKTPKGAKPFKKGESGNPNGRPKLPDLNEAMVKALLGEHGSEDNLKKVLDKITKLALEGNLKAIELLLDRAYGKPKQSIDHSTLGERITPPITWQNE